MVGYKEREKKENVDKLFGYNIASFFLCRYSLDNCIFFLPLLASLLLSVLALVFIFHVTSQERLCSCNSCTWGSYSKEMLLQDVKGMVTFLSRLSQELLRMFVPLLAGLRQKRPCICCWTISVAALIFTISFFLISCWAQLWLVPWHSPSGRADFNSA